MNPKSQLAQECFQRHRNEDPGKFLTAPPVRTPRPAPRRGTTVLVVDDTAPLCDLVARRLSAMGFRVLTANDGTGAQQIVRSETAAEIDLLLTDVQMPGMRGDELADWFSHERPQARVLFMSGNPDSLSDTRKVALLAKPFSHEELKAAVRAAFASEATQFTPLSPLP